MLRLPLFVAGAIVALASVPASAARQYGAHVHGVTTLDLALEGEDLEISLSAPGANMAGFEHPPHNAQERRRLDAVLAMLKNPADWMEPAAAAACVLQQADVQLHGFATTPSSTHDEHADMDARYRYRCEAADALDHVDVHLGDRYPGTHEVVVNMVLPQGEGRQVLGPGQFRVVVSP